MTGQDSLHSLLNYECLLFHSDWLGSDLRVGHFFSLRRPPVNTPYLNTQLLNELNSRISVWVWVSVWAWVLCYDRRSVGQPVLE
jgi:hypothetical protein